MNTDTHKNNLAYKYLAEKTEREKDGMAFAKVLACMFCGAVAILAVKQMRGRGL